MLPVDNRLAQPPNNLWNALGQALVPVGQTVVFTDSTKQFVWLGSMNGPNPTLPILEHNTGNKTPAFWSLVSDQG